MTRFLVEYSIRWAVLALAVWAAANLVGGIHLEGLLATLAVALTLGLLNVFVKPLLILLTLPATILTLGLFLIVINTALLLIGEWLVTELTDIVFVIDGFWSALLGALVISVVGFVAGRFVKADRIARNLTR